MANLLKEKLGKIVWLKGLKKVKRIKAVVLLPCLLSYPVYPNNL
jgi:hypothetical protein